MSGAKTYIPSLSLNEIMYAFGIGEVVYTRNKRFKKGDLVIGVLKMQELCLVDFDRQQKNNYERIHI